MTGPDIDGKTIGEIFAAKGFLKETPELIAAYDETIERYFSWRGQYGGQFSCRGTGFYAEDPNSSHRDMDWSRKDIVVLSTTGGAARLVNDESILTSPRPYARRPGRNSGPYLRRASKSSKFDAEDEVKELQAAMPEGLFQKIPIHAFILMFHLDLHHYLWVHVDDMEPYQYKPALKQKLVLPAEQTDLIDILTAEMDLLMDDIVAGKSGGTTVLCAGPPGVGKTLTAEVYSEIIKRPLYENFTNESLCKLTQLQTLDCGYNENFTDDSLGKLTQLHTLYCENNENFTDESLGKLTQLHTLFCENNENFTDESLGKLTQLQTLDFGNNENFTYASLGKLTQLRTLNFGNNENFTDDSLSKLTQLQTLYCGDNNNFTDDSLCNVVFNSVFY